VGSGDASPVWVEKNELELDPEALLVIFSEMWLRLGLRGSGRDRIKVVAAVLRVGNDTGGAAREGGESRDVRGCAATEIDRGARSGGEE
jgi:hypothetical protein